MSDTITVITGFAFSISPSKKSKNKMPDEEDEYVLTLAPFTRPPKINFGEVKQNQTVEKSLLIINPQQFEIELNIVSNELNINNIKLKIDKNESVNLKLKWQPCKPDSYKYSILFEVLNSARLKFLVHAFGVCLKPPAAKKTQRRPFAVLQPVKEATKCTTIRNETILVEINQENRLTARTRTIMKTKKYTDDFYSKQSLFESESTFCQGFLDTTASSNAASTTTTTFKEFDRRQTTVIRTPKLNLFKSIDSLTECHFNSELVAASPTLKRTSSMNEMPATPKRPVFPQLTPPTIRAERVIKKHDCAAKIQTWYRRIKLQHKFINIVKLALLKHQKLVRSACLVQAQWRMLLIRRRFKLMHTSALLIQTKGRQILARRRVVNSIYERKRIKSAILIQSQWRMLSAKRRFFKTKASILLIQTKSRQILAQRHVKEIKYKKKLLQSTIFIQSKCKMLLEKRRFDRLKSSALLIQTNWRGILAQRHLEKLKYQRKLLKSVIVVQSQWRMMLDKRRYLQIKSSTLLIQTRVRKILAQRRVKELKYQRSLFKSSILIQSEWRMLLAKRRYQKLRTSALLIQTKWRAVLAIQHRRKLQYERNLLRSAVLVQSKWRMILERRRFTKTKSLVLAIQTRSRQILAQRRIQALKYERKLLKSTIKVQSQWRMILTRRRYCHMKTTALLIQIKWRGILAKRHRKDLEYQRDLVRASIRVQSLWRMKLEKRRFDKLRASVLLIQTKWRTIMAIQHRRQLEYNRKLLKSTIMVQCQYRMIIEKRRFARIKEATIKIQTRCRQILAQRRVNELKYERKLLQATIRIQSQWKMILAKRRLTMVKSSLILIQSRVRRMLAIRHYQDLFYKRNLLKSAIVVQSQWKMLLAKRRFIQTRSAVVVIQRKWRAVLAEKRRKELEYELKLIKSAIFIQTQWRLKLARRRKEKLETSAAILIQSRWRGYQVRKQMCEKNAVTNQVQVTPPSSITLGDRIRNSLGVLKHPNVSIQHLILTLTDLQTVTRLSPECCQLFTHEKAVECLFKFILNCNRSIPHQDLVKFCLEILINLAKYSKTVDSILISSRQFNSFAILLSLLQSYHLTNSAIFVNVCVLFVLLKKNSILDRFFADQANGSDNWSLFSKKLLSIHSILSKRVSFATRSSGIVGTKVFNLEADWTLSKKTTRLEFKDSLAALEYVLDFLAIRSLTTTKKPTGRSRFIRKENTLDENEVTNQITNLTNLTNNDDTNITIRSVSSFFNDAPKLNSTRNHF